MAELEELIANRIAKEVFHKLNEATANNRSLGYLNQAQMADYLSITPKTFHDKIMPLSPPTVVIDGLVRYPVDEFNQWIRDNYLLGAIT